MPVTIFGWNIGRGAELRQVDYTQAVANALQELAEQRRSMPAVWPWSKPV